MDTSSPVVPVEELKSGQINPNVISPQTPRGADNTESRELSRGGQIESSTVSITRRNASDSVGDSKSNDGAIVTNRKRQVTDKFESMEKKKFRLETRPYDQDYTSSLTGLCLSKSWVAAKYRAQTHAAEAEFVFTSSARKLVPLHGSNHEYINASSPLAIACRYGAPPDTIEAILNASKAMVRRCIPNRGTPLHEAITMCDFSSSNLKHEMEYVKVIQLLLKADEELETSDTHLVKRATLIQDVDGNVPLHLLVRQAFKNYLGGKDSVVGKHPLLTIIRSLIESSPEAIAIPDCTEYEETPLIFVLKSSVYTNELRQERQDTNTTQFSGSNHNADLERRIFALCKLMLSYYPEAASFVNERNGYTAVHSAVFHGRCCDTIRLLLTADVDSREKQALNKLVEGEEETAAAMRPNSLGELPLHFAAMRGECTRSLALLSQAAPCAVLKRDLRLGMTPLHWIWVRFVDSMFQRFGGRSFEDSDCGEFDHSDEYTVNVRSIQNHPSQRESERWFNAAVPLKSFQSKSSAQSMENDHHFDLEYNMRTQAIDPSVDFIDMRYICPEHNEIEENLVRRVILMLRNVRKRHQNIEAGKAGYSCAAYYQDSKMHTQSNSQLERITNCPFVFDSYPVDTRSMGSNVAVLFEEKVISLFWAKVTSLLQAAGVALIKNADYASLGLNSDREVESISLLHIACSAPCTPLAIVRICAGLYPEQLKIRDQSGKLPLHHVACRIFDPREFRNLMNEGTTEVSGNQNIGGNDDVSTSSSSFAEDNVSNETAKILKVILNASPSQAARTYDAERRLPLHCAIDTFVKATALCDITSVEKCKNVMDEKETLLNQIRQNARYYFLMSLIQPIIQTFPGALGRKDGRTGLYPFMQAGATATGTSITANDDSDETSTTSFVYSLLRENPSLVVDSRDFREGT